MKKDKHGKNFQDQRIIFPPCVLSVDGMMGNDAQVVLTTLSRLMTIKTEETISHIKG